MRELTIDQENPLGPLEVNYWGDQKNKHTIIFADGDGSDKNSAIGSFNLLHEKTTDTNILAFSYRKPQKNDCYLCNSIEDLSTLTTYAKQNLAPNKITIIATSAGAYPTTYLAISSVHNKSIDKIMYLDPADYLIHSDNDHSFEMSWAGPENYPMEKPTIAKLLNKIDTDIKIDVVNFMLRNRDVDGYVPVEKRHLDHPDKFARLNNDMVQAFYENTPEKNRGKYIEDHQLPHAFERDGDLEKNRERIVELILTCLQ